MARDVFSAFKRETHTWREEILPAYNTYAYTPFIQQTPILVVMIMWTEEFRWSVFEQLGLAKTYPFSQSSQNRSSASFMRALTSSDGRLKFSIENA